MSRHNSVEGMVSRWLIPSRWLVTVMIVVPVSVLATFAVFLWGPAFMSGLRFFRIRGRATVLEFALCVPFTVTCVWLVARTEVKASTWGHVLTKGAWLGVVWGLCVALVLLPVTLLLPDGLRPLVLYVPLVIYLHVPRFRGTCKARAAPSAALAPAAEPLLAGEEPKSVFCALVAGLRRAFEIATWHVPHRFAASTLSHVFHTRMYEPLATPLEKRFVIGSLPLSHADVVELVTTHNVGSIVEVQPPGQPDCVTGVDSAYTNLLEATTIDDVRLRLEAHERRPLTLVDLERAVAFVSGRLKADPDHTVLIACPDGARFAPLIVAAYLSQHAKSSDPRDLARIADNLVGKLPQRAYKIKNDPALLAFADASRLNEDLKGYYVVDTREIP